MRKRNVQLKFFLSSEEVKFLKQENAGGEIRNRSAYLRKMALDGYIISMDFSELQRVH